MKMTQNRKLILRLLDELLPDCGHTPPYDARSLHYALHDMGYAEWYAKQDGMCPPSTPPPNIQQIHRTLRDLHKAGLICPEYRIDEGFNGNLPQRVAYWQLAVKVEFNTLSNAVNDIHRKVERAKFGFNLFGGCFGKGMTSEQVSTTKAEIKLLMQRTHPDKVEGLDSQFLKLQEAAQWIKSGIDAPEDVNPQRNLA